METEIANLISSPEAVALYLGFIGLLITTVVGLWIKNFTTRFFNLRRFLLKNNLSVGSVVLRGTATGASPFVLREVNMDSLIFRNLDNAWIIPTSSLGNREWVISLSLAQNDIFRTENGQKVMKENG